MDCPTEERMIRTKLGSADGVVALDFNLLERHLTIHHTVDDVTPFLEALRAIGMDGEVLEQRERLTAASAEPTRISRRTWLLGIGGVTADAIAFAEMAAPGVAGSVFGVGVDANLTTASIRAVVGGVNRLIARAGNGMLRSGKSAAEAV